MVLLKACPRCKGDLFLDEDHYGKYKSCIQCGYIKDLVTGFVVTPQVAQPAASSDAPCQDLIAAFPGAD
jgi:uncharacterized protein YbaR (Trm112 family)